MNPGDLIYISASTKSMAQYSHHRDNNRIVVIFPGSRIAENEFGVYVQKEASSMDGTVETQDINADICCVAESVVTGTKYWIDLKMKDMLDHYYKVVTV
jgi:hypothetical protein